MIYITNCFVSYIVIYIYNLSNIIKFLQWDNRCMLHFAVKDYDPSVKGMERVVRRTNWYDGVLPSLNPKEVPRKVFPYDQSEFSIHTIEKYKGYMPEDVLPSIETSRL